MTKRAKDKELGIGREITRRDFLNGVAIGIGGTLVAGKMTAETLLAAGALDQFAPEKGLITTHPQKWACAEITMEASPLPTACATAKVRTLSGILPTPARRRSTRKWAPPHFSTRKRFGEDRLVTGMGTTPWPQFLSR